MKTLIAIDCGNGYTKRCLNGFVATEPTVYAVTRVQPNGKRRGLSIDGRELKYFGDDAVKSPYLLRQAVGETDRYTSNEYLDIVIGMLSRHTEVDATFDLVLGLPSHHFNPCREALKETFENRSFTLTGDKNIVIKIENVYVFPQPLGTYALTAQASDRILVVDGGHGTIDFSTFQHSELLVQDSINHGMRFVYVDIVVALKRRFPNAEITALDIPDILANGLRYRGDVIKVVDDEIKQIFADHFEFVCERIRSEYGSYDAFDKIVFTGGMAEAYKLEILSSGVQQFRIADQPATANVRGFELIGGVVNG